jgi:DNA polymerase-1
VRVCYRVEDGKVFISFDFSSAEVKILANLSKEPAMLKAIRDGLDFHTFSASAMLGIPYDEMAGVLSDDSHSKYKEYKNWRQIAKTLTFSLLYGSSVGGIAMQLFLESSEAQRLVDLYFTTFPGVKKYIESTHLMAQWNGFILTPFGQRKRAYGTYSCFKPTAAYNAALRNAQNVSIQSPTSTLGLIVFSALNQALKPMGAKCICTVYDSIEIECPVEKAAECIELSYYYMDDWPMEQFKFLELPIGCEGDIGYNWGETKVVHRGVSQPEIETILSRFQQ